MIQAPPGREESEPGSKKKPRDEPAGSRAEETRRTWYLETRRNVAIFLIKQQVFPDDVEKQR